MLTKRRVVFITFLLINVYFNGLIFLPESVIPGNILAEKIEAPAVYYSKLFLLGVSAAINTSILLILIFKREFVKRQLSLFKRYSHLLILMVKRDFVTKYRKSILGVLWSLLNPFLTMLVMTMVFSYLFRSEIENFPVYLLSGQIIFMFFSEATTSAMGSIVNGGSIIKKVYVPKYIFPLSKVFSSLVNLFFSFIAFLIVFIATGATFQWTMLLLPIPIIYVFIFSIGISMLISSMAVFFRDLSYLYGIFITLLSFMTPLFYPIEIIPEKFIPIYSFNPLYHFVDYFRSLVISGVVPGLWQNIVCIGISMAALCLGTFVFMIKQDKYLLYI